MFGSGHNMKAVLLAIGIASVGFIGIMIWLLPDPVPGEYPSSAHVLPFGISTIVAGTIFGVGMVTAGGCVSGTIYRIAEGYVELRHNYDWSFYWNYITNNFVGFLVG